MKKGREKDRLKFVELEEALSNMGWTDWTVIASNPLIKEYKIFSHFGSEDSDKSFTMFEFILREMLKVCEERKEINKTSGTC